MPCLQVLSAIFLSMNSAPQLAFAQLAKPVFLKQRGGRGWGATRRGCFAVDATGCPTLAGSLRRQEVQGGLGGGKTWQRHQACRTLLTRSRQLNARALVALPPAAAAADNQLFPAWAFSLAQVRSLRLVSACSGSLGCQAPWPLLLWPPAALAACCPVGSLPPHGLRSVAFTASGLSSRYARSSPSCPSPQWSQSCGASLSTGCVAQRLLVHIQAVLPGRTRDVCVCVWRNGAPSPRLVGGLRCKRDQGSVCVPACLPLD